MPHFILKHNPVLSNLVLNVPCPNHTYQKLGELDVPKKPMKHTTSTHQLISIAVLQSTGSTLERLAPTEPSKLPTLEKTAVRVLIHEKFGSFCVHFFCSLI